MLPGILIEKIDEMIDELSKPGSPTEVSQGWTDINKTKARDLFLNIRSALELQRPLPTLSLSRALDFWGVVEGPLLENAATISNYLRKYQQMMH